MTDGAGNDAGARSRPAPAWPVSLAVDVGGTFTDLVMVGADGVTSVVKVSSVPADPSRGVLDAVSELAARHRLSEGEILANCNRFVHGSTVATNAVLERRLAKVGLVTTEGFRDALEIRRGLRRDQWDHREPWPPVVVPRHLRIGVAGRLDRTGAELEPLDESHVARAVDRFLAEEVEAVAVALLHSYADPVHELRVAELLRVHWPGSLTVASAELVPLLGEYERTSTAVINAGLVPAVGGYLDRLRIALADRGLAGPLLLMQSNGGTVAVEAVSSRPVDLMLSGPAAVGGALRRLHRPSPSPFPDSPANSSSPDNGVGETSGMQSTVSMEIGGTSCDVAVMVGDSIPVLDGLEVGGYHLNIPTVDVHTVGAGGGTLARVDDAGLLVVGPQGAGADPGPACYGRGGTRPTATDAHLLLGRLALQPEGSALRLSERPARTAVAAGVAEPLGLETERAAIGVLTLLEQHLRQAVESITIERGRDPSTMTLVAAGGAGGLHGSPVARALGCRRLVVPGEAGVFCAVGMLNSDLRRDVARSLVLDRWTAVAVEAGLKAEEARARDLVAAEWPADVEPEADRYVDLRYPGQLWSVRVPVDSSITEGEIRERFETEYRRLYGHIQPGGVLQVTAVGVVMTGRLPPVPPSRLAEAEPGSSPRPTAVRRCWLGMGRAGHGPIDDGWADVAAYRGADLRAGHVLTGPYLIDAATTTVLGLPGDRLTVLPTGDLEVELT